MSVVAIAVLILVCAVLVALLLRERQLRRLTPSPRRILFPFAGTGLSARVLDAALRLAAAENATLVPAYLVTVPMQLPIGTPIPDACGTGMSLLETIEQRAARVGVAVDSRVEAGRTPRHAMSRLFSEERFDRVVVAAGGAHGREGFDVHDIGWLLEHAPGEVVVLRPGPDAVQVPPRGARSRSGGRLRGVRPRAGTPAV